MIVLGTQDDGPNGGGDSSNYCCGCYDQEGPGSFFLLIASGNECAHTCVGPSALIYAGNSGGVSVDSCVFRNS